jgi:ATP-dependent helicase/nuclease subunit B
VTDTRLAAALARGATIVTPNNRLARDIVARHDASQRAAGLGAWPAISALPWTTFVGDLLQRAHDAGAPGLPPLRLDAAQGAFLWQRVVARDLADQPLVDTVSAASLAIDAWDRLHASGSGAPEWRRFGAAGPDPEAFVRWAEAFRRETAQLGALDSARAPDAIVAVLASLPGVAALDVTCTGFLDYSPQQRRLLDALERAGARVAALPPTAADAPVAGAHIHAAATPREELIAALAWARVRADEVPGAGVAVVVPDLAQSRDLVRALAEDVLCPGLQWPGRESEARPYDISAGRTLDADPVAGTALDLVALAHGPVPVARAATLLRSRHLPGDVQVRARRAALERGWRESGRRDVTLRSLVAELSVADPDLAARWRALVGATVPADGSPRAFADFWRGWLASAGWCAGATLSPAEREARGAWDELLAAFPRIGAIAPSITGREALSSLRNAAAAKPFQPEAPGARIRILGLLEATGLAFDAVWVTGMAADAWPRAPEPNPLLPLAWQREHEVPRSTPARELAYARLVTAALADGAPEVVFSYAKEVDDHPALPSPLIAHLPRREVAIPPAFLASRAAFAQRPSALETTDDARAPRYAPDAPFSGGAGLIESFSACPFQAAALHRLRAEPWPVDVAGLPPQERGRMVHAAFAAFWRDVGDHGTLSALAPDALAARIALAVAAGRAAVDTRRWAALPAVVAAEESAFVARLMRAWVDTVERPRPPFTVVAVEQDATLELAGHALRLRVDRVDQLGDGRAVIVDYKTGEAVPPDKWFGERPQGPQLALYAMAVATGEMAPLGGLAYAQLKAGNVRATGLGQDADVWPALSSVADLRSVAVAGWRDALDGLFAQVRAIGDALDAGDARVAPREPKVCSRCGLHALCRIAASAEGGEDAIDDGTEGSG